MRPRSGTPREGPELPDLAAWAATEDRAIPFVVVMADRIGADVQAYRALSQGTPAEQEKVTWGETYYVTKYTQGGWAQPQFQQTAENAWEQNARMVADEVRSLTPRHGARLVLVAGALTGARLTVLPKSLARGGGVSALLRWAEPAGR